MSTMLLLIAAGFLHVEPLRMGVLATASTLPYLAVGPLMGVISDRLPRRFILIAADLGRAVILLVGVAAAVADVLNFEILYVLAFGVGIGNVCYDIAFGSYLPFVVERDRLIAANSYLSSSQSIAFTAGSSIAGLILNTFGMVTGILANAISYVASATFLFSLNAGRSDEVTDRVNRSSILSEMWQGLEFILRDSLLRVLAMRHVTWHFIVGGVYSQLVLFLVTQLHLSVTEAGAMLSIAGLGTLAAAASAGYLSNWIGVGPSIIASNLVAPALGLLSVSSGSHLLPSHIMVGGALFFYGFCTIIYQINNASLRQTATPHTMLGRMTAATRVSTYATNAVGAVTAGVVAQQFGVEVSIISFTVLAVGIATIGAIASPLRHVRMLSQVELPQTAG